MENRLIGSITSDYSFMLVSLIQGNPYILNGASYNDGIIYYWESNPVNAMNNGKLPIFTMTNTTGPNAVYIQDTINTGGLAYRSDGITIGNAVNPAALNFDQKQYANWWAPDIFLSGVEYTIINKGVTAQIFTDNLASSTIDAKVYILPIYWYYNCNNGQYNNINNAADSIYSWFCAYNNIYCNKDFANIINAWTNLSDCNTGVVYNYCATGTICNTNKCKGPCAVSYQDCDYDNNMYECKFNYREYVQAGNWWASIWFIGIMIFILFIISAIVIVIIAVQRSKKKKVKEKSGYGYLLT